MTRPLQKAHDDLVRSLASMARRDEFSEYPSYDDALGVSRDIAEAGLLFRQYIRSVAGEIRDNGGELDVEGFVSEVGSLFVALSEHAEEVWRESESRAQERNSEREMDIRRELG